MKKIFFGVVCILIIFFSFNSVKAYSGCIDYGFGAYEDFTGYCKCMSGYVWGTLLGNPYCVSIEQYCKDKYGYNATSDYLTNECKCRSGYSFGRDIWGNTKCVSSDSLCRDNYGGNSEYDYSSGKCKCSRGYSFGDDSYGDTKCINNRDICQNSYGINSEYDSYLDKCKCRSGYSFGDDLYGDTKCISDDTLCKDSYGYNSKFNSLLDKCECTYGYEFTLKTSGGFECKSCSSKYGYYSTYNSSEKKCGCMDGYTIGDDNQCVKKQNNTYFKLIELDLDNDKALIKSEYDNKYYSVEYRSGCSKSSFKRYLNKQLVINLGTDFFVDKGDKIVLQDDNESCEIKSFEKADSDFSFFEEIKEGNTFNAFKNTNIINNSFSNKLKGKILLQVESRGEAWYVNPKDGKRYYMADGEKAYDIMRKFGVGITNKDLDKIRSNKTLAKKSSGKIFLQVESRGEAYYIDFNGNVNYLKDGATAYNVMRNLGLGIINNDLSKILEGSL